jgi:glutamate N-acetyltransferase/amino-acid N-acetyltransferase
MVTRDAEGATKLIEVTVRGARTEKDAHRAASAIGSSVLVKTAVYGASPNWGHILAAAGGSEAEVQTDRAAVRIGPVLVAERGMPVLEPGTREAAARHLQGKDVQLTVDLGLGTMEAKVWSCDFTENYVLEKAAKWTG